MQTLTSLCRDIRFLFRNWKNSALSSRVFIEEQIFSQYSGPIPELFKRFIDVCIGANSLERAELESFIDFVNNFHPALEFTWEISTDSVSFLHILASIRDNKIQTSAYYKPNIPYKQ